MAPKVGRSRGKTPGSGRKAGTPNKFTGTVKAAFEAVFKDLQADQKQPYALGEWAKADPQEFYKLAAKLIPTELKGELNQYHSVPSLDVVAAAVGVKKPE